MLKHIGLFLPLDLYVLTIDHFNCTNPSLTKPMRLLQYPVLLWIADWAERDHFLIQKVLPIVIGQILCSSLAIAIF
jgi:hypothetical protein